MTRWYPYVTTNPKVKKKKKKRTNYSSVIKEAALAERAVMEHLKGLGYLHISLIHVARYTQGTKTHEMIPDVCS